MILAMAPTMIMRRHLITEVVRPRIGHTKILSQRLCPRVFGVSAQCAHTAAGTPVYLNNVFGHHPRSNTAQADGSQTDGNESHN